MPKDISTHHATCIIDDNKIFLSAFVDLLNAKGYLTFGFEDPIAFLSNDHPKILDLIISDYQMPSINGLDLIKYCHNKYLNTPCILFTENSLANFEKSKIPINCVAILEKTTSINNLFLEIEKLLNN